MPEYEYKPFLKVDSSGKLFLFVDGLWKPFCGNLIAVPSNDKALEDSKKNDKSYLYKRTLLF